MSKASENNNNYKRRNYDRLLLQFPKGTRDRLRAAATASGFSSVNAWAAAVLGEAAGEDYGLHGDFGPRKAAGPSAPAENPPEQAEK